MKNAKKGFTLVELLVVIAIIAILATVSIVSYVSFINRANMSVDQQVVDQMNKVFAADEIVADKPATVVEAKNLLIANRLDDFSPIDERNVFYWVGSENRVVLWTKDEVGSETGKVSYPKEYAKKYKDVTTPSADWSDLSLDYNVEVITPEEGETLEEALFAALRDVGIDDHAIIALPEGAVLDFDATDFANFYSACATRAGGSTVGKDITIDLNGGKINATGISGMDDYQFHIYPQGELTLANGDINLGEGYAGFSVSAGASLILRNVNLTDASYASFFPSSEASEIIIEDSNIVTDGYFGISTNGLTSDNIKVVIKNTYFENNYTHAILMNVHSNLYIENSTIKAPVAAVAIRSGHATIINSTLHAYDPEPGAYSWDSFTHFDSTYRYWSQGNMMPGACILLGDHSSDVGSYAGDVDCELSNVKFISAAVPNVLLASKSGKSVTLTYDGSSNVGEPVLYDFPHAAGNGTVTVNGTQLEYSEFVLPDIVTQTFSNRYVIPDAVGTFPSYQEFDISVLDVEVDGVNILEAFKAHYTALGLNLTEAQWATVKFAAGSTPNSIKTIKYDRSAK